MIDFSSVKRGDVVKYVPALVGRREVVGIVSDFERSTTGKRALSIREGDGHCMRCWEDGGALVKPAAGDISPALQARIDCMVASLAKVPCHAN
ncbi:MAG: hypothetical protein KDE24_36175 [Caldilinea sp.]|nr:hypothetical protein [Caldilinea sp.]